MWLKEANIGSEREGGGSVQQRLALMPHSQMLPGEACILAASVLVTSFLYVSPAGTFYSLKNIPILISPKLENKQVQNFNL